MIERFLNYRTNLSDYLVFLSDFGESVLAAFLALAFFALFAKARSASFSGRLTSLKAVNTTFGVDNLFLTSKEWV